MNNVSSSSNNTTHSRHEVRLIGHRDYAGTVAAYHREPAAFIVARLFAAFRSDFTAAADAFTRKEWIYLAWLPSWNIHVLTDPGFEAADEIARRAKARCDIVPDRIASEEVGTLTDSIAAAASRMDPDVAKAVWALLSTTRLLNRCSDVIDEEFWYEPAWYEDLLPPVLGWRVVPAPAFPPAPDPEFIDQKF